MRVDVVLTEARIFQKNKIEEGDSQIKLRSIEEGNSNRMLSLTVSSNEIHYPTGGSNLPLNYLFKFYRDWMTK